MKYKLPIFVIALILITSSCTRVCYKCTQYCAHCVLKTDSSFVTKVCSNGKTNGVDGALITLRDSGYTCNILSDQQTVCDSKGSITKATDYFQRQDYFCEIDE